MFKKVIVLIVIFVLGIVCWTQYVKSPLNAVYVIEGKEFSLLDGSAEKEIVPGSASKDVVNVFSHSSIEDIDNNGLKDAVVLLTYSAGGSGTFYYAAVALQKGMSYEGSNAVFIGDRIDPQTIEVGDGNIIINYSDRYPWESFSTSPSLDKSKNLTFQDNKLEETVGELLSEDVAYDLIVKKLGDCTSNECSELIVSILYSKDSYFIQAIYDGLMDDSVQAQKKIAQAHYINGSWEIGSVLHTEYKCQLNRGHQDFSKEICL